jgi:hypothetical protein
LGATIGALAFSVKKKSGAHDNRCMSPHIDDSRRLLEELTVDRINEIIRATGGHIARVTELVGYGREADLPFSRRLTELAYLTGILICDEKDSVRGSFPSIPC